jgi:chain length determinant protein tyrosine kinase EpsG
MMYKTIDNTRPGPSPVVSIAEGLGHADAAGPASHETTTAAPLDRMIGQIIRSQDKLSAQQLDQVLEHQRKSGLRFGEAAIALKLVTEADVLYALSQQFHYPYAPVNRQKLNPELVTAADPFSKQSEAFRAIRSSVLTRVFHQASSPQALAVISPNIGDGKTFFAANLAVVLSQLGQRTLLIDADMRGPRQHSVFGISNDVGLSGILAGRAGINMIQTVADLPSLFVLPGGAQPPNPLELIERPAFALLLRELVGKFDYVLIDTPAAAHGADATAIAQKCGAALCVARAGKSRVGGLHDLLATISAGSVKIAGAILNEY